MRRTHDKLAAGGRLANIIGRLPGWAIGAIAIVVIGSVAGVAVALIPRPYVAVSSAAQTCANQPTKLATLFGDDQATMIRVSNPDLSGLKVLRTEPANVLPGMFQPLLSLSGDGTRLAYVTASDEVLDNAHLEYIDVANPANRVDLAVVPKGLWVVTPAWSPDDKKLAYVMLNTATSTPGSEHFELWVADTTTTPASASKQADLVADNFTGGNSASLCWTADNRVVLVPSVPNVLTAPTPSPSAQPSASPTATGSSCGVPIISQNDPAWRDVIMQAGADPIGGYGCALTSAAMMLNYFGASMTPDQLSACLGNGADPVQWASVPNCTKGLVSGGVETNFSWPALDAILASGRPAIVGMLGGIVGHHFVVVTSGGGGLADNYHITDPWDATTYKTLGSYELAGYNPNQIVSYSGVGKNCGRLIKGVSPVITTVQDGGATKSPVTISISPNLKNLKYASIITMSTGKIPTNLIDQEIPSQPIGPKGLTISNEGIYQVIIVTQAPSQPPVVSFFKFTIDQTPPAVNLSLLNLISSGAESGRLTQAGFQPATTSPAASAYPVVNRPGMLKLTSADELSGVSSVEYNLDGGGWTTYTNDTSFSRTIVVPQPGDHSIAIRGTDLAGNVSDPITKYFTVLAPPPSPSPTPTHATPPPRCTTALTLNQPTASVSPGAAGPVVKVTWTGSGGCSPFHGTVVGSYFLPGDPNPIVVSNDPISTISGSVQHVINCGNIPHGTPISYTVTLADSVGHQQTGKVSVTPC